ncbi:hypothetical protein Asp14428_13020 [Actinoplanes sp. NBRC 14428]|uniref:Uncharacterized protein n=1 Tax=Pseudosporangium ferrugineum TaxID=439699 RepID=A0A2T0SET7_9ACTN|nr:hypothetical protein [Pseudosporangium ferrugineum]PRY31935.1 hypothetical protein CLV70_102146 [Pseudosporangium ferrugineum]BCJ49827.1 hypothetical protein Asp14428_13020 [Actinoplanes sp. NBRC 14428]
MYFPNSSAMDAAAGGRGPGATVLPWIAGTEPGQVLRYVTELAGHIGRLAGVVNGVGDSGDALRRAWPGGSASDGALGKLGETIAVFQRIVKAVETFQAELAGVATALTLIQQAYRSVVGSVNPVVASLLAHPHTHAAARSLAVSATSGLASFAGSTKATLDTIATVRVAAIVTLLATIAKELGSLLPGTAR